MVVTIALLILIILILLFGAAAVKGWIRGAVIWIFGAILAVFFLTLFISYFGEDAFWWTLLGGGFLLFVGSIWARSYDEGESEHKRRVKRAQEQRRQRHKEGKE
ncbi:MAG: hypothetical protein KJZ64_12195 [Sphingomonadaceae bacterium]|nr:hypothetical protein [Sphingomonadaceae bacterium]